MRARELIEAFEMIRIAVNGNAAAAQDWFDRMTTIARGDTDEVPESAIVITSEADAAKFLRSIGR